jgi:DNA primase
MGILDEDIATVRERVDIVAVIGGYTQLKRVGSRWSGLCPFHQEKSPSFSVNAEEGLYYCFGCQASGDVITFVRQKEHTDFVGAVERLAELAGIELRYSNSNEGESRKRTSRLHDIVAAAVGWYHERLKIAPDAAAARGYLRSRGFDSAAVEQFRVGWAPDSWDELCRWLAKSDLHAGRQDLVDCGLGMVNRANKIQDFFRSRILFPIFDEQDRPIAFGGRKLPDADGPKYQNSRENVLYNKSRTLYALNWAKTDVVAADQVVICEGYTDVIGFHRAGIPRAVATCGTALTEDHLRKLRRYTDRVVLAYDADDAGQNAAERMYAWEADLDLRVSVLALPAGSDPDELSRTNPEALKEAVANAQPFLAFRVARSLAGGDLSNAEGRARVAEAALAMIAEHPNPLVQDQYLMQVADACRLDPERLREQLARGPKPRPDTNRRRETRNQAHERDPDPTPPDDGFRSSVEPAAVRDGVDTEALRLIVARRFPLMLDLHPRWFRDGVVRRAYVSIVEAGGDVRRAMEDADPAAADLLARLSVEEATADPDDVVTQLVVWAANRRLRALEADARRAENPLEFAPIIQWLKLQLEEIRGDEPRVEIRDELLAWLEEQAEMVQ